jgi:hypothetical protein
MLGAVCWETDPSVLTLKKLSGIHSQLSRLGGQKVLRHIFNLDVQVDI